MNTISRLVLINKNVFSSLLFRSWQTFAGAFVLFIVSKCLTQEEQGYFYTFSSLVGLQVIFEMGLAFVIFQFSGHFFANLKWSEKGSLLGDSIDIIRIHLLLNKAWKWYIVLAILVSLIVTPAGYYFFKSHSESFTVDWQYPWILLVILTSVNLINLPLLAVIEGGGNVSSVNTLRLFQSIIGSLLSWLLVWYGAGLWFACIPVLVATICSQFWIWSHFPVLLKNSLKVMSIDSKNVFSWRNEIWPMQWRIGISWISGYFIFQLFTPVLFHYFGAVEAGRMGMTISISMIITSIGYVWMQANTPELTQLAAKKKWAEFDEVFFRYFKQSLIFVFVAIIAIMVLINLLKGSAYYTRVLSPDLLLIVLLSFAISHIINVLAYYLRIHKEEPFMILSLIGAFILAVGVINFGSLYGARGITYYLLIVNIVYGLPSAWWMWSRMRRRWHD